MGIDGIEYKKAKDYRPPDWYKKSTKADEIEAGVQKAKPILKKAVDVGVGFLQGLAGREAKVMRGGSKKSSVPSPSFSGGLDFDFFGSSKNSGKRNKDAGLDFSFGELGIFDESKPKKPKKKKSKDITIIIKR